LPRHSFDTEGGAGRSVPARHHFLVVPIFHSGRKERFPEVPAEVPLSPCPPHCRLDRHTRGALRRSTPVMFHPEDPPSRPPDCRHRSGRNNWGCRDRSERIGLHGRAPDEDETLRSRDRTVPTATRPSPRRVRGHSMIPEPIPGHPPTHPFSDARPRRQVARQAHGQPQ
jgi:hypothetical protein